MDEIKRILAFTLSGKFAHFRKFYTNASSLSYLVPPRTVITGLLASILKLPRDSYYDIFDEAVCRVSTAALPGTVINKSTQSVNMLHDSFYKYLTRGGKSKVKSLHTQCKLEVLSAPPGKLIQYLVYVAMPPDDPYFLQLIENIQKNDCGYGLYLGQRQFRAAVEFLEIYSPPAIRYLAQAPHLDSICNRENVLELTPDPGLDIVSEQMPYHMKQAQPAAAGKGKKGDPLSSGREPVGVRRVIFERQGRRLSGRFKHGWEIPGKIISFY